MIWFLSLLPPFIILISWSKVAFQEGSGSGIQWGVGGTPFCKENSFIDTARDVGSQGSGCKPMLADVMNRKWGVGLLKKTPTEGLERKKRGKQSKLYGVFLRRKLEEFPSRKWCLCCHAEESLQIPRYVLFSVDWFGHQRLLICFAKVVCVYICSVYFFFGSLGFPCKYLTHGFIHELDMDKRKHASVPCLWYLPLASLITHKIELGSYYISMFCFLSLSLCFLLIGAPGHACFCSPAEKLLEPVCSYTRFWWAWREALISSNRERGDQLSVWQPNDPWGH